MAEPLVWEQKGVAAHGLTGRAMMAWWLGIVLGVGLLVAGAIPCLSVCRTQTTLREKHWSAEVIKDLGGPRLAAPQLALYLRCPERLAPRQWYAAMVIPHCGPAAVRPLTRLLRCPDRKMRATAAGGLMVIGPAAAPAIPELVRAAHDSNLSVRTYAIAALTVIGESRPGILALLRVAAGDPEESVRWRAIAGLGALGRPQEFLPLVRGALGDAEGAVRSAAIEVLSMWGCRDRETVLALGRALDDIRVRLLTNDHRGMDDNRALAFEIVMLAETLGAIGKEAEPAAPVLRLAMTLEYPLAAVTAAFAHWQVTGETAPALAVLTGALARQREGGRWQAVKALTRMGAAAKPAELALECALIRAPPDTRLHDALDRALRSVRGEPVEPEAVPGGELLAGLSKRIVVELVEHPLDEYLRYLVLEGALPISGPPWPFSRETCVTYRAGGVSVERVLRRCLLMAGADCEFRGQEILVFDPDPKLW